MIQFNWDLDLIFSYLGFNPFLKGKYGCLCVSMCLCVYI